MISLWDERYAQAGYLFGTEPNAFLVTQQHLLKPGMSCLAVADGEGRNGVWLAQQGLQVLSVEASAVALEKAKKLAVERNVKIEFEQADLAHWQWG
jgi:2-polyprenyl-3-methyl-5-hydroxy-6-metoxy-1,4-benzoquinol methylase